MSLLGRLSLLILTFNIFVPHARANSTIDREPSSSQDQGEESLPTVHELESTDPRRGRTIIDDPEGKSSTIDASPLRPKTPLLLTGADNFNPSLQRPDPAPEPLPPKPKPKVILPPLLTLESIQPDFRNDGDNFGQSNQIAETTASFLMRNGDRLRVRTGGNHFRQKGISSIFNIPLQADWETKIGKTKIRSSVGLDIFNRLPITPILGINVETPITPGITGFIVAEQSAYKFNAKTLENQISTSKLGANIYWQIDRNTSLFSLYRYGRYSDGNTEHQSFSRLERKIGSFSIATNLFTWSYKQDVSTERGYFSPPDFLVFNGEIAWEEDVFNFLRCRAAGQAGQQRLNGAFTKAFGYQFRCTIQVSPKLEADIGYAFSNVKQAAGADDAYNNRTLLGQLRFKF